MQIRTKLVVSGLLLGAIVLGQPCWTAEELLHISNREPKPREVGYRPADGSTSRTNPPSLIWLHEPAADRYEVEWARQPDFSDAQAAGGFLWNTYTHHAPFEPGNYYWRYRFLTSDGRRSDWSVARQVTIPLEAVEFPLPTRVQQRERVPSGHPRLFLRPEDLPRLRQLAMGEFAASFERLRAEADRILQQGPTPEPTERGSARNKDDLEAIKFWWPNRQQTLRACEEAETLAFVYLMTQDPKYGQAARRWVLHLASWDPDGPTNFTLNCEAAKPMLHRPARAYDWAYDVFSDEEREAICKVMQRRIQDAWNSGEVRRGTGHLNEPFNSHGNRTWHKIGESGIAFLGEIPEAETWLDYAMNKFFACYPVWSDDDGGWHEGVSYWSGYLSKAVWWMQVMQSAVQVDGLKKPFFAHVGDYPLYIAPPGSPNSGFGDLAHRPPSTSVGAFMEYFIRMKGQQPDGQRAGYWRWWTEQWKMRQPDGILGFLYAANLPPLPPAKAPTDLPPSKVFQGIGVASLHTTLLDTDNDVHFLFKSSPFGTQSHGHNPHNTFQLNAYGEALLTTCVYRDLHGSPFHYRWAHSTVAHNGVLVDGVGQIPHTAAPHGRIVHAELTPEWDYVVGDATDAYDGRLERYLRHVVFVKPTSSTGPWIAVFDELRAKQPATFQFMLHALNPFEVDESQARLVVQQPRAGLEVRYVSPEPLAFRQWDGYSPPPRQEFPNQWHVEASTRESRQQLGVFTVIVPYRSGQQPKWSVDAIEAESGAGIRMLWNEVATTVRISAAEAGNKVRVQFNQEP